MLSAADAAPAAAVFLAGALASLGASWMLAARIERLGWLLGVSEGMLGLLAAAAADSPEISSAVTALAGHEQAVGAGVIIGSNVFNLAALLGLGAALAGRIVVHRRVVVLTGVVGVWLALVCLATVVGLLAPAAGLVAALAALLPYGIALAAGPGLRDRLPHPRRWVAWLAVAVAEEERELRVAIRPRRGGLRDAAVAGVALLVVVGASAAMERAASALGRRFAVPQIVVGGLVLAAVTSLPNAVAAVYLARRGRGAAVLSTAFNSNALNVTVGLLLPATVVGLGRAAPGATLVAAWYLGLTLLTLVFAYHGRGLGRAAGLLVIAAYLGFVGSLLAVARAGGSGWPARIVPAVGVAVAAAALLLASGRSGRLPERSAASRAPDRRG